MRGSPGGVAKACSRQGVVGLTLALALVLAGCTGSDDRPGPPDASEAQSVSEEPPAIEIICDSPSALPSCAPLAPRGLASLGFAPERAEPSRPEVGELIMRFRSLHLPGCVYCAWHVYADGRFIRDDGFVLAGFHGRDSAYFERRLTTEGIEVLRAEIMSSPYLRQRPGRRYYVAESWFEVEAYDGDRVSSVRWHGDHFGAMREEFHSRMLDPESWLPASAWADAAFDAFVPSRYFVDGEVHPVALPPPADEVLRSRGCQLVSAEEARTLVAAFELAGLASSRDPDLASIGYVYERKRGIAWLSVWPALPHEWNC